MNLGGTPDLGQLTYCTNIHAANDWPDVLAGLKQHLPDIKKSVSPDQSMGVGLRLSAAAANALREPAAFADLRRFLDDGGFYVFTINGFPYGPFHGERVKENAYRPDWSEAARLSYSNTLADIMAALLPEDMDGSVSTVPGTFKPWAEGRVDAIVENLIHHAAHLMSVRDRTGKTISLTLEPEPFCLLETIGETISFFEGHLFAKSAIAKLASLSGRTSVDSEAALRRHLGVCYDVCHAAVEYEDAAASITALRNAGITIGKLQLSSALRIARVDAAAIDRIRPFDEPVYLHQVVEQRDGTLTRFTDLPDAIKAANGGNGSEWRVHFHVPVFLDEMEHFGTTQSFLREILDLHRTQPISPHLEVETYTWDVLPEQYRDLGISAAIVRELNWVKERLAP